MTCARNQYRQAYGQTHASNCDDGRMTLFLEIFEQKPATLISRYALAAITLASSAGVWAQAGADCVPTGTVQQVNACAVKDFQQADADHNILYGDVMRSLSAHERPSLRKEQSEWSRQRVTQCKQANKTFEAQPDWPSRYHQCLGQQIKARDVVLKRWLHEGAPNQ